MKKYLIPIIIFALPITIFAVTIKGTSGAKILRGPTYTNFDFTISSSPRQDIISGSVSGSSTILDAIYNEFTSSTIDNAINLNVNSLGFGFINPAYKSNNTAIATVDSSGNVSRVSDGSTTVNVSATWNNGNNRLTKQIPISVFRSGNQNSQTLYNYRSGSLALEASNEIDSRIIGKSGTTGSSGNTQLFSTQDDTDGIYVWNTNNFLYGIDMTMISPWNSYDTIRRAGVLITPRHIILAHHFPIATSSTIRFVKQDGTLVTRTVVGTMEVATTTPFALSDIEVAVLDSDVPSGIGFADVLPANWQTYLPSMASSTSSFSYPVATIPAVGLLGGAFSGAHNFKMATVRDWFISYSSAVFFNQLKKGASSTRPNFYMDNVLVGDSGNPSFLVVNGKLVLMNIWSNVGGGDFVSDFYGDINSTIDKLGNNPSNYHLTPVDLSGFNTY